MTIYRSRTADPTKILTRREVAAVLAELTRKATRSPNTRMNLVLFRLAAQLEQARPWRDKRPPVVSTPKA